MPELVLYGIRLLAKQFLGRVLDIEVDQSGLASNISLNIGRELDPGELPGEAGADQQRKAGEKTSH